MGITHVEVRIGNPAAPQQLEPIEMVVDSGAIYSVVPATVLDRLGVVPLREERFTLADGSHTSRRIGSATFEIAGRLGNSTVVFGRRGDACLLGAVTLEELGLMLDPLRRQLRPLRLMLLSIGLWDA
jgi:clan AA aspartic protease